MSELQPPDLQPVPPPLPAGLHPTVAPSMVVDLREHASSTPTPQQTPSIASPFPPIPGRVSPTPRFGPLPPPMGQPIAAFPPPMSHPISALPPPPFAAAHSFLPPSGVLLQPVYPHAMTPLPNMDAPKSTTIAHTPAGRGRRFVARLIDSVAVMVLGVMALVIWASTRQEGAEAYLTGPGGGTRAAAFLTWVVVIATLFNEFALVALTGSSVGKLLVGTKIVTKRGHRIGAGRAFVRYSPALILLIPVAGDVLGIILVVANVLGVLVDPEQRSAFDRISATRVVLRFR